MKTTLSVLIFGVGLSAAAFDDGFAPYRTIIDRMPFGRPSAAHAPTAAGSGVLYVGDASSREDSGPEYEKAAARIRASVRVCAVNAPPGAEPVVGFADTTQNPPRYHLLAQGQSADGWTVVTIDVASCRAVLARDGISVNLRLGAAPSSK